MKRCIILRGPAGSGKTTLSKELAKIYPLYHIELDILRKKIPREENEPKFSQEEKLRTNRILIPLVREKLKAGQKVIIDEVFYYKSQLNEIKKEFSKEIIIFNLTCPLELCLSRNRSRRSLGERKTTDEATKTIHFLVSQLKEGIKIDTSNKTIQETLKEIISNLEI
ncbi:MAG: ATP-binding protein [Nanoarchaeota archaeon]|nr:ATP-binding protein [Nanoarchaeota archaeon]